MNSSGYKKSAQKKDAKRLLPESSLVKVPNKEYINFLNLKFQQT